eukprot:1443176-Rhodomonas_salina.1
MDASFIIGTDSDGVCLYVLAAQILIKSEPHSAKAISGGEEICGYCFKCSSAPSRTTVRPSIPGPGWHPASAVTGRGRAGLCRLRFRLRLRLSTPSISPYFSTSRSPRVPVPVTLALTSSESATFTCPRPDRFTVIMVLGPP